MKKQTNRTHLLKVILVTFAVISPLLAQEEPASKKVRPETGMQTFGSYLDTDYNQKHRPQFHFSSRKNWLNDPNGMMYYDGEYHLFFQHNPVGNNWGNMTWAHAVSKDMVHWEQLPHAILPYGGGSIFSGTGAVDHNNTLGKQKGDTKTLLASFTKTLPKPDRYYQALAYSTDKGRSFELFNEGKAIVPNQGFDRSERDPKIFWHEASKKWVMILWVKRAVTEAHKRGPIAPGKIRFFTSDNLADWEVASDFDRNWVFECMDFVHLPVDGDLNNKKWLLFDASFDYEIGEFDGTTFTTDKKVGLGDYGKNYYAAQTFNNSPDGRTVVIGWMRRSDFNKVGMPFNQQMSFPTTMELRTTPDGIHLFRWPVKEIESLYTKKHEFMNRPVAELADALSGIDAELIDASIEFDPKEAGDIEWTLRGLKVSYWADRQQFIYKADPQVALAAKRGRKRAVPGATRLAAPAVNGKVKLRVLVDRGSIELFANDGAAVSTHFALPDPKNRSISVSGSGSISLVINELKSSWPDEQPDSVIEDAACTYSGTWSSSAEELYSGGTCHYGNELNSAFETEFSGTGISWHGLKNADLGYADVYIDGVLVADNIDCYSKKRATSELFTTTDLSPGKHVIRVVVDGAKNPLSSAHYLVHDYFRIHP